MKLTKATIKHFENDQKDSGTKVALHNFAFNIAADILHGVGVKNIKVTHHRPKKSLAKNIEKAFGSKL